LDLVGDHRYAVFPHVKHPVFYAEDFFAGGKLCPQWCIPKEENGGSVAGKDSKPSHRAFSKHSLDLAGKNWAFTRDHQEFHGQEI